MKRIKRLVIVGGTADYSSSHFEVSPERIGVGERPK